MITISQTPQADSVRRKLPGAVLMLLAALAVFFAAMVVFANPAQAKAWKVTNKKDSGAGSLRDAIENAAPARDAIVFSPRVRGTITLTSGELDIDKNLAIRGPGADKLTISGNNSNRVFYISSGKTVKVSGVTITKGDGWYEGGGIRNYGDLRLIKSVVSGNYADDGGGIYNRNRLRLIESSVSNNFADNDGGGIDNDGTLVAQRSTISGNRAARGGGIANAAVWLSDKLAKTVLSNSTVSGNSISSASGAGGGVYNDDSGLTAIRNTTIADNTAPAGKGGGVYSGDYRSTSTEVFSSIIVSNPGGFGPTDTFVSKGYNMVGSGQVANTFNKQGDRTGVGDATGLRPLAYNGGFTKTHALRKSSPAIDSGSPNCPSPATDQRGVKRSQGGRCDKGAFEARPNFDLNPKTCTIIGTDKADILVGTNRNDVICSRGGKDIIRGSGGNDTIRGGNANDAIYGGAGRDRLYGEDGNDRLYGQGGPDTLVGGKGNDTLIGGPGKDKLRGGPGKDRERQ